jgi:hypothetical protein
MFRLTSFFALACLALAATAYLTAPQGTKAQSQSDDESNRETGNRLPALGEECTAPFHARFSLN